MKKRLGEILLERRLITDAQLSDALALQRQRGMRLGAALVARGHITEEQLASALAGILNLPLVDLSKVEPDKAAIELVGPRMASEHDLFPYALRNERGRTVLTVAMADPMNMRVIDELSFITNAIIEARLARASDIHAAIVRRFGARLGAGEQWRIGTPIRILDAGNADSEMTIFRGGAEVKINTSTGKIPVLEVKRASAPPPLEVRRTSAPPPPGGDLFPQAASPAPPPGPDSAEVLNLTEEVISRPGGFEAIPIPSALPPTVVRGAPLSKPGSVPAPPPLPMVPLSYPPPPPAPGAAPYSAAMPSYGPPPLEFLGALVDAGGNTVDAESFARLERRFWALMRVLAKKGLLTNEDFLKELADEY